MKAKRPNKDFEFVNGARCGQKGSIFLSFCTVKSV